MIERPARRISATTRFYVGFCLAVVLVVALTFYIGYRAGSLHAEHQAARTHEAP